MLIEPNGMRPPLADLREMDPADPDIKGVERIDWIAEMETPMGKAKEIIMEHSGGYTYTASQVVEFEVYHQTWDDNYEIKMNLITDKIQSVRVHEDEKMTFADCGWQPGDRLIVVLRGPAVPESLKFQGWAAGSAASQPDLYDEGEEEEEDYHQGIDTGKARKQQQGFGRHHRNKPYGHKQRWKGKGKGKGNGRNWKKRGRRW
eukprot:TRINITY_DN28499_c0_g1_i1.p2 TRINITY_DN28499_c0_g1~~TRINITY_DN28499_c0_g1_i1.p2  ORF type:complete len:203 (+),score=40.47 TRINITY_DN28499_c0_g1_i1:112-720(+)